MRIRVSRIAGDGHLNLIKPGVVGIPELTTPGEVELFDGSVSFLQPSLKCDVRVNVGAERRSVFVVDLPADHRRVIAEAMASAVTMRRVASRNAGEVGE